MKVIGAGYGRTGTMSLQAALEQLYGGPCYHMKEVFDHPGHARTWLAALDGKPVDWEPVLHGYQATVDWPACSFYKELMTAYPNAKVLLNTRDPETWYASCLSTIYRLCQTFPMTLTIERIPPYGIVFRMINALIWKGTFGGRFLDKQHALEVHRRHLDEVKRHVPPDRLLVYEVKEGWEPLCRFLGVPVPEHVSFPRLNDTQEFEQNIRKARVVSSVALMLPIVGGMAALWSLLR